MVKTAETISSAPMGIFDLSSFINRTFLTLEQKSNPRDHSLELLRERLFQGRK
jgi:hypothetical protein